MGVKGLERAWRCTVLVAFSRFSDVAFLAASSSLLIASAPANSFSSISAHCKFHYNDLRTRKPSWRSYIHRIFQREKFNYRWQKRETGDFVKNRRKFSPRQNNPEKNHTKKSGYTERKVTLLVGSSVSIKNKQSNLIIFGTKMAKSPKLYEVHLFSTFPNSCQCTAMLNADVPNCYITL